MTLTRNDLNYIADRVAKLVQKKMAPDIVCGKEWMRRTGEDAGAWAKLIRENGAPMILRKYGGRKVMVDMKKYYEQFQ